MTTHRRLVGRSAGGLLLIVVAAACSTSGPTDYGDLRAVIDNATDVALSVRSSGPGMDAEHNVTLGPDKGSEVIVPLASTWEVKVDGKHIIGSGDQTDLALPSPGQRKDLLIHIQVAEDGTVTVLDAHYVAPERQPGPTD
jgi:hypothetical protein